MAEPTQLLMSYPEYTSPILIGPSHQLRRHRKKTRNYNHYARQALLSSSSLTPQLPITCDGSTGAAHPYPPRQFQVLEALHGLSPINLSPLHLSGHE